MATVPTAQRSTLLRRTFRLVRAGTRRFEKKIRIILGADFEDVMNLRPDQTLGKGQKLTIP